LKQKAWSNRGSSFLLFFAEQEQTPFYTDGAIPLQSSHKSFFRNVGLCWDSWLYLPPIFLGRVVVGVWTKIIDQLEGTFPELFFSFCSSKLEASQAFNQRLQLFLKMDVTMSINTIIVSGIFFLHIFHPIFRSELDKKLPSLPSFRQNKHAWGVIINGKRYWL
jgi:hypothetical protein